jgi:hypothetical protein
MTETVLPYGWKLELEIDGGHWVNWKAVNTIIDGLYVRGEAINLVTNKDYFAEKLDLTKKDLFSNVAKAEANLNQTDLYD